MLSFVTVKKNLKHTNVYLYLVAMLNLYICFKLFLLLEFTSILLCIYSPICKLVCELAVAPVAPANDNEIG